MDKFSRPSAESPDLLEAFAPDPKICAATVLRMTLDSIFERLPIVASRGVLLGLIGVS